jgi:hypothetical protein
MVAGLPSIVVALNRLPGCGHSVMTRARLRDLILNSLDGVSFTFATAVLEAGLSGAELVRMPAFPSR